MRAFGRVDYRALRERSGHSLMLVTLGKEGVLVLDNDRQVRVPTVPQENPVDICGAGDSFSAGTALALASGASPDEAAYFGNLVASVTIMKKGTGTASPAEVFSAAEQRSTAR